MRRVLFYLLLVYAALLPFERIWEILYNVDTVFKPYRIVGLLILPLWVGHGLLSGKKAKLDTGDKCFLLIFSWGVVMAFFWHFAEGNDISHTTHMMQLIGFGLIMYMFTKSMGLGPREIELLFGAYVVGFVISVAWGYTLYDPGFRFRGIQNNPNQLGLLAGRALLILFAHYLFVQRTSSVGMLLRVAAATGMVALVGLSGSRGAAAATIVGFVVLVATSLVFKPRKPQRTKPRLRLVAFLAICTVVGAADYERYVDAFEDTASGVRFEEEYTVKTAEERWDIWRSGVNVGIQHVGLGCGMSQYFTHHMDSIRSLDNLSSIRLARVKAGTHSDYVDLFASYGLIGLFGYAYYIVFLARSLLQRWRTTDFSGRHAYLLPFGIGMFANILVSQASAGSFGWGEYWLTIAIVHVIARTDVAPVAEQVSPAGADHSQLQPA